MVFVGFAMFAAQRVFANSVGALDLSDQKMGALVSCTSEDIVVSAPANESPCQTHARETGETARARAYLIATSSPGYTMTRQGPERAIARLHPAFVNRLAAAIAAAGEPVAIRRNFFGLPAACIRRRRLYRQVPLAHTYGLAVELPGSAHPAPQALYFGMRSRRGTV